MFFGLGRRLRTITSLPKVTRTPSRCVETEKLGVRPYAHIYARYAWTDTKGYVHFKGKGEYISPLSERGKYWLGGICAVSVVYYVWSIETIPYTHRRHSIMFVSKSQERTLGDIVFKEQIELAKADYSLYPDSHPHVRRVRRIGEKIAQVASDGTGGGYCEHMKDMQWEFAVVKNSAPNAFVVPGGKVVVYSGLLDLLGGSDDEVAAVLAHEVSHILARHQAERLSTMNFWGLMNIVLRIVVGMPIPGLAVYLGIFLPYSRLAEHEADSIGLRLMARACFDPNAAPVMLARLQRKEEAMERRGLKAHVPPLLGTHPLTSDRVTQIQEQLPEAYRIFQDSGCYYRREALQQGAGFFDHLL